MSITKDFRFRVSVAWQGGRLTSVSSPEKPKLEVATPPEFRGGLPGVWSPEDLLVASVATCYSVTLAAVAERREIPLYALNVSGTGHVTARDDGRFGFVAIELTAALRTEPGLLEAAESAAHQAERACLISMALDIPVHVEVVVRPVQRTLDVVA
ncbi:MAG TPA: OsmC family protein [Gaiellaceae bacterium]